MRKSLLSFLSSVLIINAYSQVNIIDTYLNGTPTKTIIASSSNGVLIPRDLDFHPSRDELWVVLKETENGGGKTALIKQPGKTGQTVLVQKDGNAWHFMSLPTGIAFSPNKGAPNNTFATSPGVFDANHNGGAPFTGPSLWSSNPLVYAQNPGAGLNGSHLDMLHESPYSMGICADVDNIFWVNDGYHNTVVRYDFKADHGPGAAYHGDGVVRQYTGLALVEDPTQHIVSHLILDKTTGWLYIADTGNKRIVRLNTTTGSKAGNLSGYETPMAEYSNYTGYSSNVFVTSTGATSSPSGIDFVGNRLIVSDYATGNILVYGLGGTTGTLLGTISTGAAGIMGVKINPTDGKIWYVNATTNQVVRLNPVSATGITEEEVVNDIQLYPNPASGSQVTFSGLSQTLTNIKIYNTVGQLVLETKANEGNSTIDISKLSRGTYIVQLYNAELNTNTTKKLIVIK